jgi:hypothetical protein
MCFECPQHGLDDIAHAAAAARARIIVVSPTTPGAVTRVELRKLMELPPGIELWVGGPASDWLISTAGHRVRAVAELTDVVPMLSRHAH